MVFKKGQSGNPHGRPARPEVELLRKAIESAKKKHGSHLIDFAVEKAYKDNDILKEILKKILPDLSESDMNLNDFRQILVERFKPEEKK